MPPTNKTVSIIIPAFNEEKRLGPFLTELAAFCKESPGVYDIVVVDDGSSDGTAALAQSFAGRLKLTLIRSAANEGKGAALKKGALASKGDICVFMDADGSYSPRLIEKNLEYFDRGFDVVAGSRFTDGTAAKESTARSILRSFFMFLVKLLLFSDLRDTQCGFKLFSRRAADAIFPKVRLCGFGMDLEALYLAKKMGFRVAAAPVTCEPKPGSKVRVIRDSLTIFRNIFEIRAYHAGAGRA